MIESAYENKDLLQTVQDNMSAKVVLPVVQIPQTGYVLWLGFIPLGFSTSVKVPNFDFVMKTSWKFGLGKKDDVTRSKWKKNYY